MHLAPVLVQPIAAGDVAAAVGRVAVGTPIGGIVEIAGPEELRLDEWIRRGLDARHDPRLVVADPHGLYFGAELGERTLVPDDGATLATTTFEDWLATSTPRP